MEPSFAKMAAAIVKLVDASKGDEAEEDADLDQLALCLDAACWLGLASPYEDEIRKLAPKWPPSREQ